MSPHFLGSSNWVFTQDGRIKTKVGATGLVAPKGVLSTNLKDETSREDRKFGELVAKNIVAPNHDHFFTFRLDIDIDGRNNSFQKNKFKKTKIDHPYRKKIWTIERKIVPTEDLAKLKTNPRNPSLWKTLNPNIIGPLGHHPGYILKPSGSGAHQLLDLEDWVIKRGSHSKYNLWVTPYSANETYAAGKFINQSQKIDGLAKWTQKKRSIRNTDIVLWYTMGMHHAPVLEDWPVMPTAWSQFELKPHNFFSKNPALDLKTSFKKPLIK